MWHFLFFLSAPVYIMKCPAPLLLLTAGAAAAIAVLPSSRIAGGREAAPGQFPWLVVLRVTNRQDSWILCGGVLITPDWVLIAAHCLDSERPEWLVAVSGEHRVDVKEGTEQVRNVDYFIQHPDYIYYQKPYVNDVGLVHVDKPFVLNAYTRATPLRTSKFRLPGLCIEAGWGQVNATSAESSVLMFAEVPILHSAYCESIYSSTHDPNAICAGYMPGGVGFCAGDNGGGLLCWEAAGGQYVVSGVLSWRHGCAETYKPGVYMDVAPYFSWVMSVIYRK